MILPELEANPDNCSFEFLTVNQNDFLQELLHLSNKTSLDIIEMDNKLLRLASPLIAPVLAHIFNLSLAEGHIPKDWKLARVTPVFKNCGSQEDPSNFRPISVVPTVTKIFEKCIKSQFLAYLTDNNLLCPQQFAYLKHHSTATALHSLADKWLDNINNKQVNGICQLDLSKGFDTVNIDILLHKLVKYGVSAHSITWFESYFTQRSQIVTCNGLLSKPNILNMGIPQGTVLGPIFFLIYVNDFPSYIKSGTAHMYADDSTLSAEGNNVAQMECNLQASLNEAAAWFSANRLVVNGTKSSAMLISTPHVLKHNKNLIQVKVDDVVLPYNTSSKILGVVVDSNLKWDQHINHICKKVNPKIGLIHRLRQMLPLQCLNMIYISLIQPHFDYCITIWGSCAKKHISILQKLQNRAARAMTGIFDYNQSVSEIIRSLNWVKVEDRYKYFLAVLVYKCLHKEAPLLLTKRFLSLDQRQDCYQTRAVTNGDLKVPHPNMSLYKSSLAYSGSTFWNSLPLTIRGSSSIFSFKFLVRNYLTSTNVR